MSADASQSATSAACPTGCDAIAFPASHGNGQPATSATRNRSAGDGANSAAAAAWLAEVYAGRQPPEAVRMLMAIAGGSSMGPEDGWFGPAQMRYDWTWLAALHGIDPAGSIPAERFRGPTAWFERLDRDRDGQLTADDFDWSDAHPFPRLTYLAHRVFRNVNARGDGRLTRDEWLAFFDRLAEGRECLTTDALRDGLLAGLVSKRPPPDLPGPESLVRSFFGGEFGSMQEGPNLGEMAPDFLLPTHDGARTIRLRDALGGRPVVLVFGNFTCPPFRTLFGVVNEQCRRYANEATFLAMYGRESHPSGGWALDCNARAGIDVPQPRRFEERAALAARCHAALRFAMPLLVDDLADAVSHAYSGMPCRLYVLSAEGRVVYKSGRGPFGFRPDEMEQALLMTLLDGHTSSSQ